MFSIMDRFVVILIGYLLSSSSMSWDMSFNYLIKVLIEEISDISESPILPSVEIHNFLFSF